MGRRAVEISRAQRSSLRAELASPEIRFVARYRGPPVDDKSQMREMVHASGTKPVRVLFPCALKQHALS